MSYQIDLNSDMGESFGAYKLGNDAEIIGITKGDSLVIKDNGTSIPVAEMRKAWNDPIWNIMGGAAQ